MTTPKIPTVKLFTLISLMVFIAASSIILVMTIKRTA